MPVFGKLTSLGTCAALLSFATATAARADDAVVTEPGAAVLEPAAAATEPAAPPAGPTIAAARPPGPDTGERPPDRADTQHIDQTWLYVDDARIPPPLKVIGTFNAAYTDAGSPTRIGGSVVYKAMAANVAQPGALFGIGGEVGLFSHFALMTTVDVTAGGDGPTPGAGLIAGARVQAFPDAWKTSHLVVSGGYLREAWQGAIYEDDSKTWIPAKPYGDSAAWAQLAFSQDLSRVRLAATVHAEHVFAEGRDPIDVMIQAGASCLLFAGLRLGGEYVGQDLEEAASPAAEGGVRHFLGPAASLQLMHDRMTIVAGPSFGLSANSPKYLGRAAMSFGF